MLRSRLWLTLLSAASVFLFSTVALGDQVKLNNGDIITGEIVRKSTKVLELKTSYAGKISIAWKEIASINSDKPLKVMLTDDSIVDAKITPRENSKGALNLEGTKTSSNVSLAQIKFINPTPIESGIGIVWTGKVNLSGAMTTGNAENAQLRIAGETVARSKQNRLTAGAVANRAESNSQNTEENLRLYTQYDHYFSDRWYAYANASAEYDPFRDIKLRSRIGSGLGYSVFKTAETSLDIELGLSNINTDFGKASDENNVAGRWALRYNQKLFDGNVIAFHNHELLFGLEDINDSLLFTQTGLRFPIYAQINASTQLNVDYAKNPAPGRKSTDTTLLFGLDYGW